MSGAGQDKAKARERPAWKQWFDRTSMYGFELFMAVFGLTTAAIVIDYGLFAICNYLKGIEADSAQQVVGEFSLWIVAAMLVWLPLALGFYLRARGEQVAVPERTGRRLHKIVLSLYFFINILILAGALFTVLYSLIRMATGAADMGALDMVVRVTIPALLMAVLHGWLLFAFSGVRVARRTMFSITFAGIGIAVMIVLALVSFGTVRGAAMDDKRERDLSTISNAIRDHYQRERALPHSLRDLTIDNDKLKLSLDEYTYDRQLGARYELCADFVTDTRSDSYYDDEEYSTYGNFSVHDKGRECFKVRASYSYLDEDSSYRLDS